MIRPSTICMKKSNYLFRLSIWPQDSRKSTNRGIGREALLGASLLVTVGPGIRHFRSQARVSPFVCCQCSGSLSSIALQKRRPLFQPAPRSATQSLSFAHQGQRVISIDPCLHRFANISIRSKGIPYCQEFNRRILAQ